jgi:ATP-dependent helicase/nuclease subunit A
MPTIHSLHRFTDQQVDAIRSADRALVVTAGAGSGKTRTLVGRYLALLESGLPLRSIVAITFTEKAAREMRTRMRTAIETCLQRCDDPAERSRWEEAFAALDGARIGTIHALCAEILRAHPAEAQIDPDFDVLDENQAALLKSRAIESALAWAATTGEVVLLFDQMTEHQLREALDTLVEKRLDAAPAFEGDALTRWSSALEAWLRKRLEDTAWATPLDELTCLQAHQPQDKLETARREVLSRWSETHVALEAHDWDTLFAALIALRSAISAGGRKDDWDADALTAAREAMKALRGHFDTALAPLVDKKRPLSWTLDEQSADVLPLLRRLFDHALAEYERLKGDRRALDFDDLEAKALTLLSDHDEIHAWWRSRIRAVLVDEFQDTNSRQQQIVYALGGFTQSPASAPQSHSGTLFVVGDGKQSIYRFRGADVAVFRRVQADVVAAGGRHVSLDRTFRAHAPLVALTNDLLAPILGQQDDPARPYAIPFTPLKADRAEPRSGIRPPYVELHLGLGESADEGRAAAATGLARRLHRLRDEENVDWGEMALLFRAATGFPAYENALEQAGIPFVTVAGRGFYDRPEVRDLLNGLAALADPTDDLALAGLLRSPAFALTDAALYLLRRGADGERRSLWDALAQSVDHLAPADASRAQRAREIVAELHGLAGRISVGNLLSRLLDVTHYRAALHLVGGRRLCRNVDKLLADAHRSNMVSVGDFLEYVQSLRDVAAREGEAPIEAEGAVQLMTIHKAKGLEFRILVIADAAHTGRARTPPVLVTPSLGILMRLWENGTSPIAYRLASLHKADQEDAESRRLLYVAATRAQEKLIVSGHVKAKKDSALELRGWLAWMGEVIGLDQAQLPHPLNGPQSLDLAWGGGSLACVLYPMQVADEGISKQVDEERLPLPIYSSTAGPDLTAPLVSTSLADADAKTQARESDPPRRVWRVVPAMQRPEGPAWVVGSLVHAALQQWRFPDNPGLDGFLRAYALAAGLTDAEEIHHTTVEARRLLARFQAHPLYDKLNQAKRYPETPYAVEIDGSPRSGIVDLLCRLDDGWTLVEFKTDQLRAGEDLATHIRQEKYDDQIQEYVTAATALLGERPRVVLVFLNVGGQMAVIPFDTVLE